MDTQAYILEKYHLTYGTRAPIEIPNVNRESLAALFAELGFKKGIEVGTEAGTYAEILCKAIPGLDLTCVDMWQVYDGYRDYNKKEKKLHDSYYIAADRLAPYNAHLVRKFSMDAVKDFEDNSLDFVYIDANHEWPFVTQDIYYWNKKVRSGGIVAGHDYYRTKSKDSRCHVVAAVNSFTYAYFIYPWFLVGTKAINPGELRDHARSWFFVKE